MKKHLVLNQARRHEDALWECENKNVRETYTVISELNHPSTN